VGVVCVIGLFLWLTRRVMHIGRQAIALDRGVCRPGGAGVGIWMGFQALINMGVNLGALPTKGLTLPLMSYGGSAILVNLVALAVVLRIDHRKPPDDARRAGMSGVSVNAVAPDRPGQGTDPAGDSAVHEVTSVGLKGGPS